MSKLHNANRARWQRLRKKVLKQHNHLCVNPFGLHKDILKEATEVHHILTAEEYKEYFYNQNNLIPLCEDCHKEAHRLLRTDRIKYLNLFKDKIRGVSESLQLLPYTPPRDHLTQISNEKGANLEESTKCFFDSSKNQYYCSCFKCFRQIPCTKCNHLTHHN